MMIQEAIEEDLAKNKNGTLWISFQKVENEYALSVQYAREKNEVLKAASLFIAELIRKKFAMRRNEESDHNDPDDFYCFTNEQAINKTISYLEMRFKTKFKSALYYHTAYFSMNLDELKKIESI